MKQDETGKEGLRMSRYFSEKYIDLEPYTPGEQPGERRVIKLNTNENPYPPLKKVADAVAAEAGRLSLYPDPSYGKLRKTVADMLEVSGDEVIMTNGSDEILLFAFMAFCDGHIPAIFPDVTYGFYPVFGQISQVPCVEIPLEEDLTIDIRKYFQAAGTIFIANPNAPTGIALSRSEIEQILVHNPYNVVVVDEAYVDFGGESCVPLIRKYENLLVTRTFSKSRSMAGARLGMGIGNPELIRDLNTVRNSMNPYNVNRLTVAAATACLEQDEYNRKNCETIRETRNRCGRALREMGFEMTASRTNFLFVRHPDISGEELYLELKKRGILVRHFSAERIRDYNRISVGTPEQMDTLVRTIRTILEERA